MSRHEYIMMFKLIMKALFLLIKNSSTFPEKEWELRDLYDKFMNELEFQKDG